MSSTKTPPGRRAVLIGRVMVVYCVLLSLAVVWVVLFPPPPYDVHRPDFGVFWAVSSMLGGQTDQIYDPVAVTEAQSFIADPSLGLFPWVYPPTALGLVAPFSWLPFWTAYAVWIAISVLVFMFAARRLAGQVWPVILLLAMASFPYWTAVKAGQLALFLAALVIAAVLALERRPILAGVLIAVIGLIKPQLMILAPVALIAGGHWRAFLSAGFVTVVAVASTLVIFGPQIWRDWFAALSGFPEILVGLGIETHAVTWRSFLTELGLDGTVRTVAHVAGAVFAVGLAALIFARTRDPRIWLVGLVGCAFFITPYAMKYDLLILLPVAGWLLVRPKHGYLDWWLALTGFALFFPIPPIAGAVLVLFVPSVAFAAITQRL